MYLSYVTKNTLRVQCDQLTKQTEIYGRRKIF